MSSVADGNHYEDVFVFGDLVYAMERLLCIVHVYRNHRSALIKLHDVRYPCECSDRFFSHSVIGTNEHIIQCCGDGKLVSIQDRSGELLRTIPIADVLKRQPKLCQVDFDGNFLIADRYMNRLLIAHVNQPSSQWRVVNLPDLRVRDGCWGAVWFRHRLYVVDLHGRLITFTPVVEQSL